MCLQTTWTKPKVATKNITVYKLVRCYIVEGEKKPSIHAPYESFKYNLNKLYRAKMVEVFDDTHLDDEAGKALRNETLPVISIGPGFHSALTKTRLGKLTNSEEKIAKAIIPKGAKYYEGLSDLIVSNQIKIVEIL